MKVFITKHAFQKAIYISREGEIIKTSYNDTKRFECFNAKLKDPDYMVKEGEFFKTLKQAKEEIEQIRLKKIDTLKKQIEKLEKFKPKVIDLNYSGDK